MKKSILAPFALSLLALGCGINEKSNPSEAQTEPTQYNQTLVSLPPVEVNSATIDPILNGEVAIVDLQGSHVKLNLVTNPENQTLISVTDADGVVTYYQKESEVIALRKDIQTFLQGVWVAIAQVKGGVHFKLVVDPQNRLTLTIDNTNQGIQIDIQIQGTPSQEQVTAAEQQFIAWVNSLSSTTPLLSSSSIGVVEPVSSSISDIPASSSSAVVIIPVSSSISEVPPNSSSETVIIPLLSSSSIAQPSSSSLASSSSVNTCMLMNPETAGYTYVGYLVEKGLPPFTWADIKVTECTHATASRVIQNTTHYYSILFTSANANWNPAAGTLKVTRTSADGSPIPDIAPCTRTILGDGGKVYEPYTGANEQAFLKCMQQY